MIQRLLQEMLSNSKTRGIVNDYLCELPQKSVAIGAKEAN
jgi:hypothetical protein